MKILAIGRNYVEHIEELNNEIPDDPVIFSKPDTAVIRKDMPFYYPSFTKDVHYELEVVIRICREGKTIDPKFAHKYYDQFGLGIDFTARDLQSKLKSKGLPWDIAKGFNGSAPISEFRSTEGYDMNNLNFSLNLDSVEVQKGNTSLMMYNIDSIVSYLSKFFTLKKGDLIFTGTPKGVGPVAIGNRLEAFLEDEKVMDFEIK